MVWGREKLSVSKREEAKGQMKDSWNCKAGKKNQVEKAVKGVGMEGIARQQGQVSETV